MNDAARHFHETRLDSPSGRLEPSDGKHAALWVSVVELMGVPRAQGEKWLESQAGVKGKRGKQLGTDLAQLEKDHDAKPLLAAALSCLEHERVRSSEVAGPGRVVIQPGDERKRTSSHYTPPELSGAIVARALEPLLACFGTAERGGAPTSAQTLSLQACDRAMGSGAFLVEARRYLGERLLEAWTREGVTTTQFGDDDDLTDYAGRQIPALEAIGNELCEAHAAFMVDTDQGFTKTYDALKDPTITEGSEHGPRIAYSGESGDPSWTDIEIPGFTELQTEADNDRHERFEDHVLDKLLQQNPHRSRT